MTEISKDDLNKDLKKFISQPYKFGFSTDISKELLDKGLNEELIKYISYMKKEPEFLTEFRIKGYKRWKKMKSPEWSMIKLDPINYQDIIYYVAPIQKKKLESLDEVDPELLETFEKLGIPLTEQKRLANVAVDAVFDSVSIGTTFKKELNDVGIIFMSITDACQEYPDLVKKYLGTVVPIGDNYYSALNSAMFTDGSFCYIPENVKSPLELSTYFRIDEQESGQFERTLIIADKNSYVSYLEGCTAPQYDSKQLHAAIVELIALDNSEIKYSTIQNWFSETMNI